MIAKLTIAEGVPLMLEPDILHLALGELLVANRHDLEYLQPGVYDITPKIWTTHTHNHELVVLDNGEGLYRIFPRDANVGSQETSRSVLTSFRLGGRQMPINAKNPRAVIAGLNPAKQEPQIFGIIAYLLE